MANITHQTGRVPKHQSVFRHIPSDDSAWGPDYAYKLWLAHGITTVRDAGCFGGFEMVKTHRDEAARGDAGELARHHALARYPRLQIATTLP